jgi:hypothetical protein
MSPDREDRIIQSAVLLNAVVLHPVQVTEAELIREVAVDPDEFGQRDGIERAVRDLVSVALLHRHGAFVLPTRAALCAYELLSDV